ncbi:MAG: PP2C family protein-serine/threonine phosphatase [Spirochaetota bacterium]
MDRGWEYAPQETTHDDFSPLTGEQLHSLEDLLPEGEGVLWLKKEFKKPSQKVLADSELLGLFLGRITMADVTYLNGRVIGRTGRFAPDFFSEWNTYRHYTFPADLLRERNTLLVKVYVGHEGALVDAPFLAPPQVSGRHWRRQTFFANYLNMGISLVMLVISLYHFWLFLKRRRERENLYFALLNLAGAIYLTNFFVTLLPGYGEWTLSFTLFQRVVANSMIYVITLFTALFVRTFLRRAEHSVIRAVVLVLIGIPIVMSFLLPDYQALREMRALMLSFIVPVLLYIIYMLVRAAADRQKDAQVLLIGMSPLFITVMADIVIHNYLQLYQLPYIGGYGFPLMIFALLFILAGRFAEARNEAEDLNINLEQKVEKRTEELAHANLRLQATLDQLQAAQQIAAKDMAMAVRVQQSFYPERAPRSEHWDTGLVFQPANGVAGDLYDFFIEGKELYGAALFDVSGHGISSGLVAMLAKAIIARNFIRRSGDKLSSITHSINSELISQKGEIENYVTGILLRLHKRPGGNQPDSGRQSTLVEFVNAGHTQPLVMKAGTGRVHDLGSHSRQGSILGIPDLPAQYPTMRMKMEPGDLLLLYSDALSETMNYAGRQFGSEGIRRALEAAVTKETAGAGVAPVNTTPTAQQIADSLQTAVRRYAGLKPDEPLKDDLTIIALRRR